METRPQEGATSRAPLGYWDLREEPGLAAARAPEVALDRRQGVGVGACSGEAQHRDQLNTGAAHWGGCVAGEGRGKAFRSLPGSFPNT